MAHLLIHTEVNRSAEVVTTVIGELDAHTAPELVASFRSEPVATDVFDLRFVTFMSAAGITALLQARQNHPCRVVVSPIVHRVVQVCELIDVFAVEEPAGPPCLHRADFGVAVHDRNLRFVYVNDCLAKINGLPAQDHYGQHPTDLFDVAEDEVTGLLHRVFDTRQSVDVTVTGSTAALVGKAWRCRYQHINTGPTQSSDVVVATVEAANIGGQAGPARLEFIRADRYQSNDHHTTAESATEAPRVR